MSFPFFFTIKNNIVFFGLIIIIISEFIFIVISYDDSHQGEIWKEPNFNFKFQNGTYVHVIVDIENNKLVANPSIVMLNSSTSRIIWTNLTDEIIKVHIKNNIDFRVPLPPYYSGSIEPNDHGMVTLTNNAKLPVIITSENTEIQNIGVFGNEHVIIVEHTS